MRRISAATTLLLAIGGLSALGLPAAQAGGGTVTSDGSSVTFTGTAGDDFITYGAECDASSCQQKFLGDDAVIAGAGCVQSDVRLVACQTDVSASITINLGAGSDVYDVDTTFDVPPTTRISVDAGPGDDSLEGAGAIETWVLGDGNDRLKPDVAEGPEHVGPDDISGGPGTDTVEYLFNGVADLSGVRVSLDDLANDGTTYQPDVDNVRSDVEQLVGTNRDDTFVGNDLVQRIDGAAGNDSIAGGGGDDILEGGLGIDTIDGGAGLDTIAGGPDNDTVTGGTGYDIINGDAVDLLITGNDTIDSVDGGPDYVACGPGTDSVTADLVDEIAAQSQDNCESVTRISPPAPTPTPTPTPTPIPTPPGATTVKVSGKKLDADQRRKKASIKVACASATGCIGKVVVKKGKQVVAKGTYAVPAGKTGKVAVKLTKKGRALLRKKKSVKVVVTLTPGGSSTVKLTR